MNQFDLVLIAFELAVLVFAFSVHESAHAWMAARRGDPTALMLGRITLNPASHIDPIGTIILPLVLLVSSHGGAFIGWAKPTPVNTRNFKKPRRDDILTTAAGPVSNLLLAALCLILLLVFRKFTSNGDDAVFSAAQLALTHHSELSLSQLPSLFPIALLLYFGVVVNVMVFVFNLIPFPPLDGARILRNVLPYNAMLTYDKIYDRLGFFRFILFYIVAWPIFGIIYTPTLNLFNHFLGFQFG